MRDRKERTFRSGPVVRIGSIAGRGRASVVAIVMIAMKAMMHLYEDIGQVTGRLSRKEHGEKSRVYELDRGIE